MFLTLLVIIPFLGSLLCWMLDWIHIKISRWIALITTLILFIFSIFLWLQYFYLHDMIVLHTHWNAEFIAPWIPRFGIQLHFALDGLSILMIILTTFLGFISVLCSWDNVKKYQGFFYFNLLWIIIGTLGVLLSIDLFLFFCFWEIMFIPIYCLIIFWGDNKYSITSRIKTANVFLIYTQLSSMVMLFSILLLSCVYYNKMHIWTFDYNRLIHIHNINPVLEFLIMLGFFIAFTVKMPIVPLHSWLPDMHKKSPIVGSVDLSGMLVKVGAYGLIRFNMSMFTDIPYIFLYCVILLGITTIFYGSWMAYAQTNIKKIISYSSISHMGFILIAIYSKNIISYEGAIMDMIFSGLSISALFILFNQLYIRVKTNNIVQLGGLSLCINWIPGFVLFFLFANLNVPGTANFIGEIMMLMGIFTVFPKLLGLLIFGLLFSLIYSLNIVHKVFYGSLRNTNYYQCSPINCCEFLVIIFLLVSIIFFGFFPDNILHTVHF
ncbi:NuoM family protein [Buchnera aphidicola]|uniref:NADH-quinone oxidoreductase subunit M n=1 Tax=Buchnera aphidicola (Stegophylla sp.) TaxID=2315800 RepID=A0A4D6YB30_9GAMM|nr:NADH-quinone oxidoreductase subunit M [Buchnera aphidicola (Stegophylla sp.)]QCI26302.1 NADH-quinone oxidoreductase subunit M [Buchnera aphidicola (Stegophylla sp.)]